METYWITCPLCNGKTRLKLLPDTVLINYPLFCPKCKEEVIINAEHLQVSVAKKRKEGIKPDAQTQSLPSDIRCVTLRFLEESI